MFITSGVVTGFTRLLEEALHATRTESINIIGIMHWQSIMHKDRLVQDVGIVKLPKYPIADKMKVGEVC